MEKFHGEIDGLPGGIRQYYLGRKRRLWRDVSERAYRLCDRSRLRTKSYRYRLSIAKVIRKDNCVRITRSLRSQIRRDGLQVNFTRGGHRHVCLFQVELQPIAVGRVRLTKLSGQRQIRSSC